MTLSDLLDCLNPRRWRNPPPTVAVIALSGVIAPERRWGGGLNIAALEPVIARAFALRGLRAVALAVNSPGGSAAQSALIAARIRQLAAEKGVPVIAFVEDAAASGGYWLACAADEIIATPASVVGSIGVIYGGFGFGGLMERLGVERRLFTAGARKSLLDPFGPEKAEDVERLRGLLGDLHETFKDFVRERRGERLKGDEEALFSGEFWTGRRALELGLIDGLGDLPGTLKARFGDKLRIRPVGAGRGWLRRRFGLRSAVATAAVAEGLGVAEEWAWWARLGL